MAVTVKGTDGCFTRPLKDGPTPDITDDYYIKSICPSGAMAAGTASRYKTGPRLATHSKQLTRARRVRTRSCIAQPPPVPIKY